MEPNLTTGALVLFVAVYLVKEIVIPIIYRKRNSNNPGHFTTHDRQALIDIRDVICRKDRMGNPLLITLLTNVRDTISACKGKEKP